MFGNPRFLLDQESLKPKRTSETLSRLARHFTPWWPALLLTAVFMVISTWVQVTTPELTGQVVDCYLSPAAADTFASSPLASNVADASQSSCWLAADVEAANPTQAVIKSVVAWWRVPAPTAAAALTDSERVGGLAGTVLIWIILFVASAVLTGATFYTMSWAGQHVLRGIRVKVFEHLHRLPVGYYAEHEVGDLMSRITNDSDTIQQALNFVLVNLVSGFLLLGWIAYNMLSRNLPFALLSMVVAPLMFIATAWFSSQARKAFRKTRVEMGSVNANLQESISAVREAQAFNRAEENIENFRATSASYRDANVRAVAFTSALAPVLEALGYLGLAVVTVVGGLALLNGSVLFGTVVSIGLVITFLGYVQRFNQPIQQISVLWGNIQSAIAGAERIFGLLDVEPAIVDRADAKEIADIQGRVEFDQVNAEYKAKEPVLKGVDFVAEPGQTVAIVGPTGAGKTTIINLIPRFYDVTGGAVKVDGFDVRELQAKSLRKQIGIVLQDTFLFSTTVMENIRFGRPDASDEEVFAAASLAHADSFIERLPEKYQTILGERGSGLSQGQRQLLAIARAALADPRILILDEATSSVDTRTERLIQQALEKLLTGRTSFVIAHRLSTIRNADVILVLRDGQIVERGIHQELLDKKGFYYELYMSQFKKQEESEATLEKIGV
ncbi:MAG TPA: ABC transporter ATP-binding protein [Anaerolineales bacterium]|nr:ABC transporter ATP-binding protein [Anaerolineales bacterium]